MMAPRSDWSTTGAGLAGTGVENCSEHGSDRPETLPKRVSDDSGRFVFRRRNFFSAKILDRKIRFLLIWHGFGGATAGRTSKSASSSNFALERLIESSTRPKNLRFGLRQDPGEQTFEKGKERKEKGTEKKQDGNETK